jgi:outer membrane autotransporter protein
MKNLFRFMAGVGLFLVCGGFAFAEDKYPQYLESVQLAVEHAANPANWRPASLFVIPDTTTGTTEGLTYDGANLIVRTATRSSNFSSNYVGQANYKIWKPTDPQHYATWVTTGNDATKFLQANGVNGANVMTLLERGLGMDATGTHDAIVEYAVDTQYLLRPTRNPDISQYLPGEYGADLPFPDVPPAGMSLETFNNFKAYYDYWKGDSGPGAPHPFPWTQLGYTFFWGNGYSLANINGMSEFILLGGTPAQIHGIYATQSYIYTLNKGGVFSADADAQYGNGFASFNVDGSCDTLWAGHRFQKNVSHDTENPNQIIITPDGSISGGQGILVWSLNYDLENRGVISDATGAKFGIAGTGNVAVLFKGDTTTAYGAPVAEGINRLTNYGVIESPGTAVKVEAGDSLIANEADGIIYGGTTGIDTAAGRDWIRITGGFVCGGTTGISTAAGRDEIWVTGGVFGPRGALAVETAGEETAPGMVLGMDTAIATGDGGDLVVVAGGRVLGGTTGIDTGAGNDRVGVLGGSFGGPGALAAVADSEEAEETEGIVSGGTTGISTGAGRDDVRIMGGAVLGGETAIDTGAGKDRVRVYDGTVRGGETAIDTGAKRDYVQVTGGIIEGGTTGISTGAGRDEVLIGGGKIYGGTTAIATGDGKDKVKIEGGTVSGGVSGITTGDGADKVKIKGGIVSGGEYAIKTGKDDDRIVFKGGELAGRIDMGAGTDTLTVKGSGDPRFSFTLDRSNALTGQIVNTEAVSVAAGSNATIAVTVGGTTNIRNNDRFLVVEADTLDFDPAQLVVLNDGRRPMVTFTAEKTGSRFSLVAARDASYYGRRGGNASLGAVLDFLAENGSGEIPMILEALDGSGDPGNARQLEPNAGGGILQAGFGTAGLFHRAVVGRIDQVRAGRTAGTGMTGIATGESPAGEGVWGRGFGAILRQDSQGNNAGYQADVWGGSFGYDRFVFDHLLAGFGGGYARNRVRSYDDLSLTHVDSYQANVYGSLARDAYHIDALLSFAYNFYKSSRHIAFGGIDCTARGDYSGQQYSLLLEGGYDIQANGFVMTPLASVQVMRLHINGYTEEGAGALDLSVGAQDYNFFETGLGAKLAYPLQGDDLRITPEIHAKWLYDFAGDRQQSLSRFSGGGASFSSRGIEPGQSTVNVGAKLSLMTKSNVTVSLNYDLERKSDFAGHTGSVHVRYDF